CSNRSAGPPALTVRSTISVTSSCGSTSTAIRTSSPSRSRRAIQDRRSAAGAIVASLRTDARGPVVERVDDCLLKRQFAVPITTISEDFMSVDVTAVSRRAADGRRIGSAYFDHNAVGDYQCLLAASNWTTCKPIFSNDAGAAG